MNSLMVIDDKPLEQTPFVFVYGSLKRKFHNHRVLTQSNGRFIGPHKTPNLYTMYRLSGYPAVVEQGDTAITGEVYEVDTFKFLDILEGHPSFFNRKVIQTEYGPAWMYVLKESSLRSYRLLPRLTSGVWNG